MPDPAGPLISTREPVGDTRSTWLRTAFKAGLVAGERRLLPGAQPKFRVLRRQPRRLERPPDDKQQPVRLERLFDEIVGANAEWR